EAVAQFRRALSLKEDFAEAANNLGNALRERGEFEVAATELSRAMQLDPGSDLAIHNLALLQLAYGRYEEALVLARRALDLQEWSATHALSVRCLKESPSLAAAFDLRPLLLRALSEPWGRPNELVPAVVHHLKSDATVGPFVERGAQAGPDALARAELLEDP